MKEYLGFDIWFNELKNILDLMYGLMINYYDVLSVQTWDNKLWVDYLKAHTLCFLDKHNEWDCVI